MHGMIENEMGNCGSKSAVIFKKENKNTVVKEQRVDGSYFGFKRYPGLRCTLMALEREYHIKNLSRRLNCNRLIHSLINDNHSKLNPYFVTGFVDAEGYFGTSIYKNNKLKTG
jgi:hypothetical protein